jgi:maleylacetoacetate isomerase
MLTLYDYFRSTASYRVRIALHLKNVPFETIPIHLVKDGGEQHHAAYDRINPEHLVPCLQVGETAISQSLAIMEYLEECYPAPSLWPMDALQKAKARSFALAIIADLHPLNNLRVLTYLKTTLQCSDAEKDGWYQHWIAVGLAALEKKLQREEDQTFPFAFANTPTIADICLVPQLYNARRFLCPLHAYPRLVAIESACLALPAFANAAPHEPS